MASLYLNTLWLLQMYSNIDFEHFWNQMHDGKWDSENIVQLLIVNCISYNNNNLNLFIRTLDFLAFENSFLLVIECMAN